MVEDIKITTIGGGTGSSTILKGLKKYFKDITAIVTVADDGGSSGMLREDLGVIPPGDIRACLISLANTEKSMERLMNYRFKEGNLKGQNFGNLFLVAMADIYKDFVLGIEETSNILAITGKVLPVTLDNIKLFAELENGEIIEGESNITALNLEDKNSSRIDRVFISPKFAKPLNEVVYEIYNSDVILIGPGSLYTSVIPNLLISEIGDALVNTKAKICFVLNVVNQSTETFNYKVIDHLNAIYKHCEGIKIDTIIVNNEKISDEINIKYKRKSASQLLLTDEEREYLKKLKIRVLEEKLVSKTSGYSRHNEDKLARLILENF
ncbi:YvcK family protein [uncultured Parvimonas sp.]|uniref:gluconeogenesis factor YvcK family protein n=1 Tax=Parvimonas parva TaxID=2769485 RepID=UPI0028063935|nr:YvcK family protein [uncultured Parvimonas sp.]